MAGNKYVGLPYKILEHLGIEYSVCKDFGHISRYKGLRQVVHNPANTSERFLALETPNPFQTSIDVEYYEVPSTEENRLDLIAQKKLGAAEYSWILAYFNNIEDGFTVRSGQQLVVPKQFTSLFNSGEVLQSISPLALNLGFE